jgi:lysylphosphatidylglycerol synthetase-like protein (DUF2156 family)
MIWRVSQSTARAAGRGRFGLLAIVALFVAHDAIFLAEYGIGDTFAAAMRQSGHDGYWPVYMLLVGVAGAVLIASTALRVARLRLRLSALGTSRPGTLVPELQDRATDVRSYPRELMVLWIRLFAAVVVAFVIQENLEHAAHHHVPGLEVLFGPENPLALPALAAVTFVLAAVGALVRWRIAILGERLARAVAAGAQRTGLRATRPAAGSWVAAAVCARQWTIARQDPGRAPPPVLHVA